MALASALLQTMIDAVRKTARPMLRDFGEVAQLQVSRKGPADFVTAADIKAEHTWIVDPIDGTTNFMHAMPHFAITVALERRAPDGTAEIVAGVTFNPVMNELFWAEKGKGAYLNDSRIRVTGRKDLSQCLIGTGLPFMGKTGHGQAIKDIHAMGQRVAGIRRLGSAALDLAWVAAGRYDAFWERNLKPWDVAAGLLFVTEAGGVASTIDGTGNVHDGQQILVANSDLHPQIAAILRAT